MKNVVKFSVVLGLVCLGAALGVGFTYRQTRNAIFERELQRHQNALQKIFKGDLTFTALNVKADLVDRVFQVRDKTGGLVGYAATGLGQGYSSKLKVLVGAGPKADAILGVNILFQEETPGLGARVTEVKTDKTWAKVIKGQAKPESEEDLAPEFPKQFSGIQIADVKLKKAGQPGPGIEAMTGATITSRAVLAAVKDAIGKVRKLAGPHEPPQH